MAKNKGIFSFLGLVLLLIGTTAAQAAGIITVQVEILPGFSISAPSSFSMGPLMPDQSAEKELELTVWSNVPWELTASLYGFAQVPGILEVRDGRGVWLEMGPGARRITWDQPETGPEGTQLKIPFRFSSGYADAPGTYTFQLEFTVVPAL